jgi:predicted kinase
MADQVLLLMKGYPATGKSTLACALAQCLRWPLLDKDDIKDFTVDLPDGNALAYRILWQMVRRQLRLGLSVIADSPLSYPEGYAVGQAMAAESGARLLVVEVQLDEKLWRRRLDARPRSESTHKIAGWGAMQRQLAAYAGCDQYPIAPEHHLVLDGALPAGRLCDFVRARLGLTSTNLTA